MCTFLIVYHYFPHYFHHCQCSTTTVTVVVTVTPVVVIVLVVVVVHLDSCHIRRRRSPTTSYVLTYDIVGQTYDGVSYIAPSTTSYRDVRLGCDSESVTYDVQV